MRSFYVFFLVLLVAHFAVHDVFLRVSEEMIFKKYKLKRYVLCFSVQY